MKATTLIESFSARGFSVWADGDAIKVAPSSALTDEDRAVIRERKAELLALLRSDPGADENPEMHDSAFFDVVIQFHGGPDGPVPLRIPQQSTPPGGELPF